jgi:type I restriction enzyme, S subunit
MAWRTLDDEQADQLASVTVESGDVLLNITGDSVARSCRVPDDILPARVNQHVAIIRPRPEAFDSRFVAYFLVSRFMQDTMLSLAGSGGTRKALTKEMIERFELLILHAECKNTSPICSPPTTT